MPTSPSEPDESLKWHATKEGKMKEMWNSFKKFPNSQIMQNSNHPVESKSLHMLTFDENGY